MGFDIIGFLIVYILNAILEFICGMMKPFEKKKSLDLHSLLCKIDETDYFSVSKIVDDLKAF